MGIMTLAEIMDRAIEVLRKNIKTIAMFSLGYGIITFLAIIIFIIFGAIFGAIGSAIFSSGWIGGAAIGLIVLFIISFALSSQAGIIKITSQEFLQEEVYAHTAIKTSFKSILKVLGIVTCAFIIAVPIIALYGYLGYLLFKSIDNSMLALGVYRGNEIVLSILMILYIVSLFFIVMAFITWFIFTLQTITIERRGVFASLRRSFWLVRRNYWRTFGSILLFSFTVGVLRLSVDVILAVVAGILYFVLKLINVQQDFMTFLTMIYGYLSWPLNLVTWMVVTPIGAIMLTLLYFNERFKKEGYDLELSLWKIREEEERKQTSEAVEYNGTL